MNSFPGGLEATISALIAVFIELFPPVKGWWDRFAARQKQAIVLLIVLVVSIAGVWFSCWRGGSCPEDWFDTVLNLLWVFIASLIASQGAHRGVKHLTGVTESQ